MSRAFVGFMMAFALVLSSQAALAQTRWEKLKVQGKEAEWIGLAINPKRSGEILAISRRTFCRSEDSGENWPNCTPVPARASAASTAIGGKESLILLATNRGLYGSEDLMEWLPLFHGSNDQESHCTHVAFLLHNPDGILLGTRQGLLISEDRGLGWKKLDLPLEAKTIVHFVQDPSQPSQIYVVSEGGLFLGNLESGQWHKLVTPIIAEEAQELESEVESEELEKSPHRLSAVVLHPIDPRIIYAATNRGVIVSSDGGQSWRYLEQSGLASTQIKRLAFSPENPPLLYAATSLGVARYDAKQKRWQLLTSGLTGRVVNDLALSTTAILAATAEGLYRYPLNPAQTEEEASSLNEVKEHFAHEPSVLQVQQAAIRYAEVHPEKIAAWRQQARWQALLPDLTLSTDTNLTDFRHWDSGTSPDSLLRGERDIDWSASLTWDFGDFVWSTDQTSIDSRSKLMVELRDDIVDTVTRTYFERRRLQAVQLTHPLADSAKQLEQALRIEELTALIDGLTGGYFSKTQRERK